MLVSFFRKPILLKVVGTVSAIAFLLSLIRYKHGMKIILPLAGGLAVWVLVRRYVIRRRKRLSVLEEEYLRGRFYEH